MTRRIWSFLAPVLLVLAACSKDEGKPTRPWSINEFPPTPPALSTMEVDVADLSPPNWSWDWRDPCRNRTSAIAAWAVFNLGGRLKAPKAVYAACLRAPAVFQGDSTWRWIGAGGAGGDTWTAELTATLDSVGQVNWEMLVSGTALRLNRFAWLGGLCDPAARAGSWVCYDTTLTWIKSPSMESTWSFPARVRQTRLLSFRDVDVRSGHFLEELRFSRADTLATASVHLESDVEADEYLTARWNLRDGSGKVINFGFFHLRPDSCCWGPRPFYAGVPCP